MKDLDQMANTFFDFSSLKNGEHITLPEEEDCLENEEDYDALNDETFGDLDYDSTGGDWEQQHEQFAEFDKSSVSHEDKLEDSLQDLILRDIANPLPLTGNSVWSYTPPKKNGEISSVLESLQKASQSFVQSRLEPQATPNNLQQAFERGKSSTSVLQNVIGSPRQAPKICTVEELEKNLLKSSKNANQLPPPPRLHPPHQPPPFPRPMPYPYLPQHANMYPAKVLAFPRHPYPVGPGRHPPGMPPINIPPPMRHVPPPGFRMMPPHPLLQGNMPPRPPGMSFPYHINQQIPPHLQRGNMPPMPQHGNRNMPPMPQQFNHQQYQQYQQRQRTYSGRSEGSNNYARDEYEGLMTAREKQWLLNIQLLQLNTGTPYFDDYYYTVFKERKSKSNKENFHQDLQRYQPGRQRRNSDRQENPLTPRVYTPLQFENSLGKLQCGSVTAPRKIIDMDVVSCDKDSENSGVSARDTRKTKQLLLELEVIYSLFLKAEDLTNPVAIGNLKVLRDIKQKQRLRELEAASTPEQKQEVLELVKRESEPVVENPNDYLQKILTTLLQEDKFTSFINIRKGKMLLLRLLPALKADQFFPQVVEIWSKILLSLPIIGRRDTAGDNILPKFYPLFKRYIQTVKLSDILENIHGLTEVNRLENSRSTPLGHQGKSPLYFVLMNKFGISAIAALCVRSEFLISTNSATEKQQTIWFAFVSAVADVLSTMQAAKIPAPIEGVNRTTFSKMCQRTVSLTGDKTSILNKHFVDCGD